MAHIDFWLCCINHFSSKSLIDTIEEKFVQVATKQQTEKLNNMRNKLRLLMPFKNC